MSDVWKRLANVARGTVKTWGNGERDSADITDDFDVTPVASSAPPRVAEPPPDRATRRRALLDMALADGVISREEYDSRLGVLAGDDSDQDGTPAKPKKRTL